MIKHIVFFRFTDSDNTERKLKAESLAGIFSPLKELEWVRNYRLGINISNADYAWDVVIDSEFESSEDLDAYRESAEHQKAIASASVMKKEKCEIDYQF